jgi:threonine dehydratase
VRTVRGPTPLQPVDDLVAEREVLLKREDDGPNGAFKWRGALCACASLADAGATGVVAASTGNHGAAVAWAAASLGLETTVVVPEQASETKCALIVKHGARLHREGATVTEAARRAATLAEELGHPYLEDGASAAQLAGTATIGRELAGAGADTVLVPVGCGALAAGIASALAGTEGRPAVVGVQAAGFDELTARFHGLAWRTAKGARTIADGLAETRIVEPSAALVCEQLDDLVVIDDEDLIEAMRELWRVAGLAVEAAAAAPLAALRRYPDRVSGRRVALVVSGRNLDRSLADRAGVGASARGSA